MIVAIIVIASALVFLFGFVVLFGAPYVPTMRLQVRTALEVLDLQPGQTLLELGSGDGKVALAAAQQGIRVYAIEINPLLVLYARLRTWRYRQLVTIKWANIWQHRWPADVDGIYVFLLDRFMPKLDKKITQTYKQKPVKLVSFAFEIPGRKPALERNGLYLYKYNK